MVGPSPSLRRWTSALLVSGSLFAVGCAQSAVDPMLTKHDFATNPLPQDLSAEDLTGADLSGADLAGFDAGGDMIRTTWTDKSFSTTNMLWSVWSNGNSLVYAVGKGNTRVSSVSGSAFAQDASGRRPARSSSSVSAA